jgi:hypothetical protein
MIIPCMVDNIEDIKSKECRRYIEKMSKIVFSDYRLIYKFADKCHNDIQKLSCGRLETQQVEVCDQIMFVCLMVFKATFNNISAISWQSVFLMEETRGPGENHGPVTDKLYHIMLYTSL